MKTEKEHFFSFNVPLKFLSIYWYTATSAVIKVGSEKCVKNKKYKKKRSLPK